jgi:hypothetical protein
MERICILFLNERVFITFEIEVVLFLADLEQESITKLLLC